MENNNKNSTLHNELIFAMPEYFDLRVYTKRTPMEDALNTPVDNYYWRNSLEDHDHGPFLTLYVAMQDCSAAVAFHRQHPVAQAKTEEIKNNVIYVDFINKRRFGF